jgi:hypothetical protein
MTTTEFLQDEDLIKSWRDALAKDEIVKLVMETMEESSPAYGDTPETAKESSEFRFGFMRGYTYYHQKLKEMGRLKPVQEQTLRRNWGVTQNAARS